MSLAIKKFRVNLLLLIKSKQQLLSMCLALIISIFSYEGYSKELKIGYFVNSPHILGVSNKKPIGAVIEWFETYIKPNLNYQITWIKEPLSVSRLLSDLENGMVDGAILFAKRPDREKYLFYPKASYLKSTPAILVRNDFPKDQLTSLEDINNIYIGFGLGAFIPPNIKSSGIKFDFVSGSNWQETNIKKLIKKRIDAVFDPQDIVLNYLAHKHKIEDRVRVMPLPVPAVENYTVFSKKTTSLEVLANYERALEIAEGMMPYKKFLENWE